MSDTVSMGTENIRRQLLDSLEWRCIGPHRGGRVVAVAGDVSQKMTFYMGACAGGVWKTTDGGTYWHNIGDGYFNTAAIGALAVAASDSNVIYAGTGESTIRGNVSHGDGVYKSDDAGMSWQHVGLSDSRHIGKIVIHPRDPDHVYVAAFGHAFGPNEERGVFRSLDGGGSWKKVLYKSERAGSHDVAMDVNNPRILFAAIWQAQRYPHKLENGGPDCGLWRSMDGGDSWQELTPTPGPSPMKREGGKRFCRRECWGRSVWRCRRFKRDGFGLALKRRTARSSALTTTAKNWVRLSEESLLRTRPWYYMHVTADTQDADTVLHSELQLMEIGRCGRDL